MQILRFIERYVQSHHHRSQSRDIIEIQNV